MTDLLPPNSTALERAISNAMDREGAIATPAALMWDPARIPAVYLPWLAWASSVDHWPAGWSEAERRAAIAASADWHRRKGTRWSVETALSELGHPDAVITEERDLPRYDAELIVDGGAVYGPAYTSWAAYWVIVQRSILHPEADLIAARLVDTAPARCKLNTISITAAEAPVDGPELIVDGGYTYDGVYNYGDL